MNTTTSELMVESVARRIRVMCNDLDILTMQTVTQRRIRDSLLTDLRAAERMANSLLDEMKATK